MYIRNDINDSEPPTNFKFIEESVFCVGTIPPDPEARYGCTCRAENGRSVGCEYRSCSCLEDVAQNADGTPIGFPYHAVGGKRGCLRNVYLDKREHIYECNPLCSCPPHCKNKVVQHGRQIPLEIFKTQHRGWGELLATHLRTTFPNSSGLRSTVSIRKGQFIDTYRGEIITNDEADRREEAARAASETVLMKGTEISKSSKDSYFFNLDKFVGSLTEEEIYVVDGQYKGGPTRFLNHSCNPNLRQFTVSCYRGNPKVYELAFFAREDIEALTELTFDYLDLNEPDESLDESGIEDLERDKGVKVTQCYCGSENCRGYLW